MNNFLSLTISRTGSRGQLFLMLFIVAFAFSSCKTQKKIQLNKGKCILDFKNARTLTTNLKTKELQFEWFKAKLSADAYIDSASNSFSVALRIKKDSVIWMSLSKLGIEGARILITKDSVKFVNTIDKRFFKGDFAYISKLLNTELDFEMLQSLLVGNSVTFYDEDEKIKPGMDNCQYTLGTVRKFKIRKAERGRELREPAQSIYLVPETFKISRILFYEFNPDRSFDARYADFINLDDGQLFPNKMNYIIKAQKNVNIDLNYSKVTLNEEQSFPFKIPDNYEQIIYKGKQ
jgi:hypothetical protein